MKLGLWLQALLLCGLSSWAQPTSGLITSEISVNSSNVPLTTEKVWTLDPYEKNPHRVRWVLQRQIEVRDLKFGQLAQDQFGVMSGHLVATLTDSQRPNGPWYQEFQTFNCAQEPSAFFGTSEGSKVASLAAQKFWRELVDQQLAKLKSSLLQIRSKNLDLAKDRAQAVFSAWIRDLEGKWSVPGRAQARLAEWRYYLQEGTKIGLCKPKSHSSIPSSQAGIVWHQMMEPVPEKVSTEYLARAPAKRWDGLYSVRVTLDIYSRGSYKSLNGRFLIDSGSSASLISPSFLASQGVSREEVEDHSYMPQKVIWSGGSEMAYPLQTLATSVANLSIPIREFLVVPTEIFGAPDHKSNCCDGILGTDFLRQFGVELLPGPPAEVMIWPRDRFRPAREDIWLEASLSPKGELMSEGCSLQAEHKMGGRAGPIEVKGARWDTGSLAGVDLHRPWLSLLKQAQPETWRLQCPSGVTLARGFNATDPTLDNPGPGPFDVKYPGFNVGMELLSRGPMSFDLPHGRVWFASSSLQVPLPVNRTGLYLDFEMDPEGERILLVRKFDPRSESGRKLAKQGLARGVRILKVDGIPVQDLDSGQIQDQLSGKSGPQIELEWKARGRLERANLTVRAE